MFHQFRYTVYTLSLFLCLAVVCVGKNADVQQGLSGSRRNAIVNAVEYASLAVVNISTTQIQEYAVNPFFQDLWSPFFDMPFQIPQKRELHGLGSGIIISEDGYILTTQHVIEDADFVEIILFDGQEFEAEWNLRHGRGCPRKRHWPLVWHVIYSLLSHPPRNARPGVWWWV